MEVTIETERLDATIDLDYDELRRELDLPDGYIDEDDVNRIVGYALDNREQDTEYVRGWLKAEMENIPGVGSQCSFGQAFTHAVNVAVVGMLRGEGDDPDGREARDVLIDMIGGGAPLGVVDENYTPMTEDEVRVLARGAAVCQNTVALAEVAGVDEHLVAERDDEASRSNINGAGYTVNSVKELLRHRTVQGTITSWSYFDGRFNIWPTHAPNYAITCDVHAAYAFCLGAAAQEHRERTRA